MPDSKDLLKMDYKLAATTPNADLSQKEDLLSNDPLENLCRSTSVQPDAHQSELLSTLHPDLKIPSIRSHMLRGNLTEAQRKISELENDKDEITQTEVALEKSRLAAFNGKWTECLELCQFGLNLKPPVITHLCLLQVRAVALFELGAFPQALNDSDMVISQAKLFPQAVAVHFSKAQRVKTLLLLENYQMAQSELANLWKDFLHSPFFNLDQLLVLFRLELECRRVKSRPHARAAQACLSVARAVGDRLYEGMALLDLIASLRQSDSSATQVLAQVLTTFETEFSRIKDLKDDFSLRSPLTTTGHLLKKGGNDDTKIDQAQKISQILTCSRGILIDLERKCATDLGSSLTWLDQATILSTAGILKEEFFKSVWKLKYSPHLHDGVLRTFLHRQRKKFGLKISASDGRIYLNETLVIS